MIITGTDMVRQKEEERKRGRGGGGLPMIDRLCARFAWLIITPFGSLVLPLVYCRKAILSEVGWV